jgi:hypothetical protein
MADDQIQRPYRSNEAPARSTPSATSVVGSDPLAELARLIGQTDPFAEFGRENPRRVVPPPAAKAPPPSFGPADYFDASTAPPPPRPSPLQPPPAYVPPSAPRQPYATARDPHAGEGHAPGEAGAYDAGAYHPGNAHLGPEEAGYYEDAPPPKRRMGIIAIAAVLALAVIGTAGAFGYRAMFGGARSSAPPPVIKADTAPSKIVPAPAKTPAKLITDRIGDHAEDEKLVSREEKPVEIKAAEIKTNPALATIPPPQGNAQQGAAQPAPGGAVMSTEPKKVHTIAIHPDQMGEGQQAPVAAAAPTPPTPPLAPPVPARASPPPQASNNPPPLAANAAPPPPRPAEARTAAPAQGAAQARGNGPLSLSPDAPPARQMRTAAVSAPPPPAAQATHTAGGYAVQVSSQRSEADAQAAFRGLQAKYPKILGGRQASIHKVELGAKGTYYRAMVGPFANANEATELCNGLRAAGGQCLIQRN